jgi:Leucine-rich repeat (LRR) protein
LYNTANNLEIIDLWTNYVKHNMQKSNAKTINLVNQITCHHMYKARYDTLCNIRNGGDYPHKEFNTWDELKQSLADIWDTITILSLLNNGLNELPSTAGYWPRALRHIYLGRNNLKRLPNKPGYWPDKLITISIPNNNIRVLPSAAGYWPARLASLVLFGNDLESIPDNLGYLPKSLEMLNIANNFITHLPSTAGYWPARMMYLNIAHNSIQELPDNLLDCRWICKMIILDNPIISISPEIKQWLKNSISLKV